MNTPGWNLSLAGVTGILVILLSGTLVFGMDIIVLLMISCVFLTCIRYVDGIPVEDSLDGMREGCSQAFVGLLFFLLIGAIIGVWIQAGTVPVLVYYGLDILTPRYFLVASFVICSLVSLVLGTSWGTVGTVGVAIMGVAAGSGLSIPTPVIAGSIVSGAWFGDKMSPISDSTVLTATASGTDVYRHIRAMSITTLPAYGISLVLFFLINKRFSDSVALDIQKVQVIREILQQEFVINLWVLFPAVLLVILCLCRVQAVVSLVAVIVAGCVCSIGVQGNSIASALGAIMDGCRIETASREVNLLLNRGGVNSMMYTFLLGFLALCLGGLLQRSGYLHVILERVIGNLKRPFSLIAITMATCVMGNAVFGDTYLTIVLNGNMYQEVYDRWKIDRAILSRTIEEAATMSTPLIPWTAASAFIYGALEVGAVQYGPFAVLNLVTPLCSLCMAFLGVGLTLGRNRIRTDRRHPSADSEGRNR